MPQRLLSLCPPAAAALAIPLALSACGSAHPAAARVADTVPAQSLTAAAADATTGAATPAPARGPVARAVTVVSCVPAGRGEHLRTVIAVPVPGTPAARPGTRALRTAALRPAVRLTQPLRVTPDTRLLPAKVLRPAARLTEPLRIEPGSAQPLTTALACGRRTAVPTGHGSVARITASPHPTTTVTAAPGSATVTVAPSPATVTVTRTVTTTVTGATTQP